MNHSILNIENSLSPSPLFAKAAGGRRNTDIIPI